MKKLLFTIFTLVTVSAHAQNIQSINSKAKFKDGTFSDIIKSAKIYKTGNQLTDPIITLNSGETVTLSFDEVTRYNELEKNYYYTIEHRDADWNTEGLITNDYMAGFTENNLTATNQSQGTGIRYRNYNIILPNSDVRLKISGNYLVKVFERGNNEPVIIKGFSILETLTTVTSFVMPPNTQPCMQQLDIKVNHPALQVQDAYVNLKIRVEQNSTRIPDVKNPTPAFSNPSSTDYTRPDRNVYKGLNEFRQFDIRSLDYNGQGVAGIRFADGIYRVDLAHELERRSYLATNDINGKFLIGSDRATNADLQAEYVEVRFSLAPQTPISGRIFLFGEFTDWALSEKYEMLYKGSSYSCSALLKQGFYNYRYVVVDHNGNIDMATLGGCFYDTENTYNVYVYYRGMQDRYDKLVGFRRVNNRQK